MRVLSVNEVQSVSGGATPSSPSSGIDFRVVFTAVLVGFYLLITGKSLIDLV